MTTGVSNATGPPRAPQVSHWVSFITIRYRNLTFRRPCPGTVGRRWPGPDPRAGPRGRSHPDVVTEVTGHAGPRRAAWTAVAARTARCPDGTIWSTCVFSRPLRRVAQGVCRRRVAAGALGVAHYDKSVTVAVDGQPSSVHVFGSTVGDVLAKQDIAVGAHDVVGPPRPAAGRRRRRLGALRPQADGDGRRPDQGVLDHGHHGGRGAGRARHPCRQGRAVRLPLRAARPRGWPRVDDAQGSGGHRRRRQERTVTTTGATVAGVLQSSEITSAGDDRVTPGPPRPRSPTA